MTQSARFAWWLLILLFGWLILFNNIVFIVLFTGHHDLSSRTEQSALFELNFQTRWVLLMRSSTAMRGNLKSAAEEAANSIRKELYGTGAEWEARLYVALLEQLGGVGDARKTLAGLANAPSLQLDARERRWYAPLWQSALMGKLEGEQVQRLKEVLAPSAPALALQLAEGLMWKRVGDTKRAQAIFDKLGYESQLRIGMLGSVACCGLLWALVGVGLLIWYFVQSFPLDERPLANASPFALDPMLWAPVLFLLMQLGGAIALAGRETSLDTTHLLVYMVAIFVPMLYLFGWSREAGNPSGVLRFQGSFGRQIGTTLMGVSIYLPILLIALLLTVLVAPALPSEQTNPIAERPFSELSVWMVFWTILAVVVLAPVVEEVLFRGVLFQVLWQRTGRVWLSAFVSGFLFGVIHPQFLGGILNVTLLGVVLAMVYAHSRSLLPCILIHALNNGLALLFFWAFTS